MESSENLEDNSSLEKLSKRLERSKIQEPSQIFSNLRPKNSKLGTSWEDEAVRETVKAPKNSMRWLLVFLSLSLIFFAGAIGFAGYIFLFDTNTVSGRNIDIQISGPSTIKAGDELNLQTTIANHNKVLLDSVSLTYYYPEGTLSASTTRQEMTIFRQPLDNISPEQISNVSSRAVIFGSQNSQQEVRVLMEYRVPDSNAIFTREQTFKFAVGASPLGFVVDVPEEVNSDRDFPVTVKVVSNSQTLLQNVILLADYPPGFIPTETDTSTKTADGSNVWRLGDIPAGGERTITVHGLISGQNNDAKTFKFKVGTENLDQPGQLAINYGETQKTASVKRPFIGLSAEINSVSDDVVVVKPNLDIISRIGWINNLTTAVANGSLEAEIVGEVVDRRSIKNNLGFYDSNQNLTTWSKNTDDRLAMIEPGVGGQEYLSFNILPLIDQANNKIYKNQEIKLKATFRGTRMSSDSSTESIYNELEKTMKVETLLNIGAGSVYTVGPFKNTGPMPPKVGQETTYTVVWVVKNTSNDVKNAIVKATLPVYVKWLGVTEPASDDVTFKESSRELTWNIGNIPAGTGIFSLPPRQLSFQLSLTPSLSQLGGVVPLASAPDLSAEDTFTGTTVSASGETVNTAVKADPSAEQISGSVVE